MKKILLGITMFSIGYFVKELCRKQFCKRDKSKLESTKAISGTTEKS